MFGRLLAVAVSGLCAAGVALPAQAQDFPSRPVKIVVPFPAGGGSDLMARHVAEGLRKKFGGSFIVENRPGASGNIGADVVKNSPPDGYTLMITAAPFAIAPAVNKKLPFHPVRDFTPVALIATVPLLIVTRKEEPFRTVAELVEAARKAPEKISFASFGIGSPPHLVGETINGAKGIQLLHVPYRGGSLAVSDILTGRTTTGILDALSIAPQVQAGAMRALAITGPKRSSSFPDVPTLTEAGVAFDTVGWHAMFAPANMPKELVERLNVAVIEIVSTPEMKKTIEDGGSMTIDPPLNAEQWRTRFAQDVEAWGKAARDAKVMIE